MSLTLPDSGYHFFRSPFYPPERLPNSPQLALGSRVLAVWLICVKSLSLSL